jgi:2'-5' RNA ligase
MTFADYIKNAQGIFDSFPNETVWAQGGVKPNRQIENPEAGYCIVFRYDEETTEAISEFMTQLHAALPPMVVYDAHNLHTTIGVYGKRRLQEFEPDQAVIERLTRSIQAGLRHCPQNPGLELSKWLFNNEAILVSGYPNEAQWRLAQDIGQACQLNGFKLEMSRIAHITTARFIVDFTKQMFDHFVFLMNSVPLIGAVKPYAIGLATWQCDGLSFKLATHKRFFL